MLDLLLAMFSCLIVIAVMRWVAKPLVWLSILGVLALLGFGKSMTSSLSEFKFNFVYIVLMVKFHLFQERTTVSSNTHS